MDHHPADPARDRQDLVQFLAREQRFIEAYAYAIVRDYHFAEDVYQEVAMVLARDWESVPEDLPRPWFKEVVRRKALEVARRAHRHVLLGDEALECLAGAFDHQTVDDGRLREALADCVRKLPSGMRAVIECRYREDCSCETIAERLGRSVQGIYALLKRARGVLAECIGRADPSRREDLGHA